MEIKQLYYFVEVVKYGSFANAAKMLFVTPQALSKSINHLEREYNCRLFIRKNNILLLTDIGRQFLPEAKALLEQYYLAEQRIKQLSETEQGCFRVAFAQNALDIVDINMFENFRLLYPQLNPDYMEMPDKVVDEYIENDKVEVCFNINTLPNQDEYESVLLCPSELCAMTCGSNNCLENEDYVTLKDLTDKKILLRGELYKSFDLLEKSARAQNIIFHYELKTSDAGLMLERMAWPNHVGISIYALHGRLEHFVATSVPFKPSLPWNVYLSYKKYKPISKPVQLFIKFVKENYSYTLI